MCKHAQPKEKSESGMLRGGRKVCIYQHDQSVSDDDTTGLTYLKSEYKLEYESTHRMIRHWKQMPNSISDIKKGQEKLTRFIPCCTEYTKFSDPTSDRM